MNDLDSLGEQEAAPSWSEIKKEEGDNDMQVEGGKVIFSILFDFLIFYYYY